MGNTAGRPTHGKSGTRTHRIWKNMKSRCLNPRVPCYKFYGGRGITICARWLKFENFLADMGEAPDNLTIDRFPDKDGAYDPGNARWATMKEQNNNRRDRITKCQCGTCRTCYHRIYAQKKRGKVAAA